MSYDSRTSQVIIEPNCIFCGKPTDHVEKKSFHDYSRSETKLGSQTWVNTSSASFTYPFPAHPACLKGFKSEERRQGLLLLVAPLAAWLVLFLVQSFWKSTRLPGARLAGSCGWLIAVLGLAAIGTGYYFWTKTKDEINAELRSKVSWYAETHAQGQQRYLSPGEAPVAEMTVGPGRTYTKVQAAIDAADRGCTIYVRPGTYSEPIILNKEVYLVGDGPREQVIFTAPEGNAVRMQTYNAGVRGITLVGSNSDSWTVWVVTGKLVLEDCDISNGKSGVGTQGTTAEVVVRDCRIHDNREVGAFAFGGGRVTVENSHILGSGLSGVEAPVGGRISVRGSRLTGNKGSGALVDGGQATISECDIHQNLNSGILVNQGGSASVDKCQVHDETVAGAVVADAGSTLALTGCELVRNALSQVHVRSGAEATVRDCRVLSGKQNGIYVYEGGKATVQDCVISHNAFHGVTVTEQGSAVVTNCDLRNNDKGPWQVDATAHIEKSGNQE